jgi:hypothetical protein
MVGERSRTIQTPQSKDFNLMHWYCRLLKENHLYFKELSAYLVADSFFAKSEVIETVTSLDMHFISRLRDDAALLYLNREPKTGKRGAPKKYAGKVITANPDMNCFKLVLDTNEIKVYNAIVYYNTSTSLSNQAFNRNINTSTGSVTIFPLPSFTTKTERKRRANSIFN